MFVEYKANKIKRLDSLLIERSPSRVETANTKRALDLVVSALALLVLSPLIAVLGIAIKLTSKGPVLFVQERVGKDGKLFYMYKFRSMRTDSEKAACALQREYASSDDPILRVKADPRVTRVGRLIRRFSLDELPQLLNVIKGEMSLVGPRPHILSEVLCYKEWHKKRFDILPGVTGLVQVSGRRDLTLDQMVRLDILYIERRTLRLDLEILLRTLPVVVEGEGVY